MKSVYLILPACFFLFSAVLLPAQVLFDNGPVANSTGTGFGGSDESVLLTTTFGMGTIGFGHQLTFNNRVADDFTVVDSWQIDSIVFFAYQTGSTTTSTMTEVNFMIWDGIPDAMGSSIVYGDTTTNQLSTTRFSNVYRVTETTIGNDTRPIMRNVCHTPGLNLTDGTYWIDWQTGGSLASGPWAPSRVPTGQSITGNARQAIAGAWSNAIDGGTGAPPQGFPFIIYGTGAALPIELISFTGETQGNRHLLEWTTGSELQNDYFDIERSSDANTFQSIGRIPGAGNSQVVNHYAFTNDHPLNGLNYYRLKQTDYDGKSSYSKVVALDHPVSGPVSIYPNPAGFTLYISGLSEDKVPYQVINGLGQAMLSGVVSSSTASIGIESLAPGLYFLRIGDQDIQFIKQ